MPKLPVTVLSGFLGATPRAIRRATCLLAGALFLAGCAQPQPSRPAGTLRVVTSISPLADLVRQVGGPTVQVHHLVQVGADPHTFEPKPSDMRAVADADLIIVNGAGLEGWLTRLLASAKRPETTVCVLAAGEPLLADDQEGGGNPHLWLDPQIVRHYVARIARALAGARPREAVGFRQRAAAYDSQLVILDRVIRQQLADVPTARRQVVVMHDAFAYYFRRYGIRRVGVLESSPGRDPSAGEYAALVSTIRRLGVRALFGEPQYNPKPLQRLAAETGIHVVDSLADDTLGPPPADSYLGMMQVNTHTIAEAL